MTLLTHGCSSPSQGLPSPLTCMASFKGTSYGPTAPATANCPSQLSARVMTTVTIVTLAYITCNPDFLIGELIFCRFGALLNFSLLPAQSSLLLVASVPAVTTHSLRYLVHAEKSMAHQAFDIPVANMDKQRNWPNQSVGEDAAPPAPRAAHPAAFIGNPAPLGLLAFGMTTSKSIWHVFQGAIGNSTLSQHQQQQLQ